MSRKRRETVELSPEAPGLDEMTRRRRHALAKLQRMTAQQLFDVAVKAGIYTTKGRLTAPYRDDAEPSASRPND